MFILYIIIVILSICFYQNNYRNVENREINDKYQKIAIKLINSESELLYIKNSQVKIVFLESDLEKKKDRKTVFADCEKIQDKYKWAIPYDFAITVYNKNTIEFSEKQMEILIFHELLHVGIDYGENGEVYFCNPHDIEDFEIIIKRFGLNWNCE